MGMGRRVRGLGGTAGAVAAIALALGPAQLGVQAALAASVGIDDTGASTPCPIGDPYCFLPATVTIDAGGTVTWTSNSGTAHTVTADDSSWGSNNLDQGQTYRHTFTTGGRFTYHCSYHSFMTGTVVVNGSTTTSSTTTAPPPVTSSHTTTTTSARTTTSASSAAASTTPKPAPKPAATSTPAPVAAANTPAATGPAGSSSSSSDVPGIATPPSTGSGGSSGAVIAAVVAVVLAGGAGFVWWRRRTAS